MTSRQVITRAGHRPPRNGGSMGISAAPGMTSEEIVSLSRAHTMFSWSVQGAIDPIATEIRARLGQKMAEILPGDLNKVFFTLGGAEAVENAIKLARHVTGRYKILARYRSYHGAAFGAMTL